MKIDIRPIKAEEVEYAKTLIPEGYAEPNWKQTYAIYDDDYLVGIVGIETLLVAEPLYLAKGNKQGLVLSSALCWLDGFMRVAASALGISKWYSFVSDENSKFQQAIEKHFPVTWYRERPGKWYTRNLNG